MNATKTERRERLLAALLTATSLKDAANTAGIPYETARRYLREPDFQAALADLRRDAADTAVLDAMHLAERARATLLAIMDDPDAPPHARVRAAEAALNYERAVSDLFSVHERLSAIEAALAGQQPS